MTIPVSQRIMGEDSDSTDPVLDLAGSLTRLGGDSKLFAELAGYLREDLPGLLNELLHAVAANDAGAVQMKAHAIKGLVAGCGGVRAAGVAQVLEHAGQAFDLSGAPSLANSLEAEIKRLIQALEPYRC